jgi:lipopolysaccharide export LptBFGC system permease protein LptF
MRSPLFYLVLAMIGLMFAERHRRADEVFMMSVMGIGACMMLVLSFRAWRHARAMRDGQS